MAQTLAQDCTLNKFAGDTKLGKVTDSLNGCSAIQSKLDRRNGRWDPLKVQQTETQTPTPGEE